MINTTGKPRSTFVATWAVLGTLALVLTGSSPRAKGADLSITIGVFSGSLADLPIVVAQDKGFFTSEGLKATTTPVTGGAAASAGLVSGQFDVVASSGSNAYIFNEQAAEKKSKHRMIGVANEVSGPYFVVLARSDANPPKADAPLKERLAWLSGHRVGVSARGAETENIVRGLMVQNGLNPDSPTWIAAGDPTSSLAAWTGKRMDAVVSWQPAQQQIENTGAAVPLINFLELRKTDPIFKNGWSTNTWWTSAAYAEQHSAELTKFASGLNKAIEYINDPTNRESVVDIFSKSTSLNKDIVRKALESWNGIFTIKLTCAASQSAQEFYKGVGIIRTIVPCKELMWSESKYIEGLK